MTHKILPKMVQFENSRTNYRNFPRFLPTANHATIQT